MQEKLKNILSQSSLSTQEQEELFEALSVIGENMISELCAVFESNMELITKLYRNLQAKKEALKNNDRSQWDEIVQEELKMLERESS